MKYNLLIGLFLGGAIGFLVASFLLSTKAARAAPPSAGTVSPTSGKLDTAKWTWPDSLDAVVAAPHSHGIIYEDEKVRILNVTVAPGQTEPIHTHKWRSVAWAARSPAFTLYHYARGANNQLIQTDSFTARLPLNKANNWAPEAPHAVRNIGLDTLVLYRVEFKK